MSACVCVCVYVCCVCVFRRKFGEHSVVKQYEARLLAQSYSQKFVQDHEETFSPLLHFESIRMIISLAVQVTPDGCHNCVPEWRVGGRSGAPGV